MTLFRGGGFTLKGGTPSWWKIDCDALNDDDWATLAKMVWERLTEPFHTVVSCGGAADKFADALRFHKSRDNEGLTLIVDDVLTTGATMEETRQLWTNVHPGLVRGVVVFARRPCPTWVVALFQYTEAKW